MSVCIPRAGEPSHPVSTGVRGHNKAIVPTAAASNLSALDHDYHLAGVTPSVIFQADIPISAKDYFINGTICVTTNASWCRSMPSPL